MEVGTLRTYHKNDEEETEVEKEDMVEGKILMYSVTCVNPFSLVDWYRDNYANSVDQDKTAHYRLV